MLQCNLDNWYTRNIVTTSPEICQERFSQLHPNIQMCYCHLPFWYFLRGNHQYANKHLESGGTTATFHLIQCDINFQGQTSEILLFLFVFVCCRKLKVWEKSPVWLETICHRIALFFLLVNDGVVALIQGKTLEMTIFARNGPNEICKKMTIHFQTFAIEWCSSWTLFQGQTLKWILFAYNIDWKYSVKGHPNIVSKIFHGKS